MTNTALNAAPVAKLAEQLSDGILTATVVDLDGQPTIRVARSNGEALAPAEPVHAILSRPQADLRRPRTIANATLRADVRRAVARAMDELTDAGEVHRIDMALLTTR